MDTIKTLGQLLQDIVEKEDKRFSIYDFLVLSTDEDRQIVNDKLVDADYNQFNDYMNSYTFVSEDEIYMAVCDYYEKTMNRPISMGECSDMSEIADNYIRDNNLTFND